MDLGTLALTTGLAGTTAASRPGSGQAGVAPLRAQFTALLTDPWIISPGEGGSVTAEAEQGEGDEGLEGGEPERHPGDQPDPGMGRFDPPPGQSRKDFLGPLQPDTAHHAIVGVTLERDVREPPGQPGVERVVQEQVRDHG